MFIIASSLYSKILFSKSVVVFISVVQKEYSAFSISQIPPFISRMYFLFPSVFLIIVLLVFSLVNLFMPGGLKKYKSKTNNFFFSLENLLWQEIDVITSLFVKLKRHIGIGISFKSFISCNFLVLSKFLLAVVDKSTTFLGVQSSLVEP